MLQWRNDVQQLQNGRFAPVVEPYRLDNSCHESQGFPSLCRGSASPSHSLALARFTLRSPGRSPDNPRSLKPFAFFIKVASASVWGLQPTL